jgi:hypothetical protein
MSWPDEFHPEDFHPEVGYLLPSRSLRRSMRLAAVAALVGVVVGSGMTAFLMRPPVRAPRAGLAETPQPQTTADAGESSAGTGLASLTPFSHEYCASRTWARFDRRCHSAADTDLIPAEESPPSEQAALTYPSDPPVSSAQAPEKKVASPKRPRKLLELKPPRDINYATKEEPDSYPNARNAYATPFWGEHSSFR